MTLDRYSSWPEWRQSARCALLIKKNNVMHKEELDRNENTTKLGACTDKENYYHLICLTLIHNGVYKSVHNRIKLMYNGYQPVELFAVRWGCLDASFFHIYFSYIYRFFINCTFKGQLWPSIILNSQHLFSIYFTVSVICDLQVKRRHM